MFVAVGSSGADVGDDVSVWLQLVVWVGVGVVGLVVGFVVGLAVGMAVGVGRIVTVRVL